MTHDPDTMLALSELRALFDELGLGDPTTEQCEPIEAEEDET